MSLSLQRLRYDLLLSSRQRIDSNSKWVLYELSNNPELQNELRAELSTPGDPSADDLQSDYPLLDAVLKEVLRIHPPILENHHQVRHFFPVTPYILTDYKASETICVPLSEPLPGTTDTHFLIPKGTILGIPLNVLQRDQSVWGADAEYFRPRRWLDNGDAGIGELFTFSHG